MDKIKEAELKAQEALELLREVRRGEEKKALNEFEASKIAEYKEENDKLQQRIQELENKLLAYEAGNNWKKTEQNENTKSPSSSSRNNALKLYPQRSSFRLLSADDEKVPSVPVDLEHQDSLASRTVGLRKADDKTRSGFYLQMSTEYNVETKQCPYGAINLAPMARGRVQLKWMKTPYLVQIVKRPGKALNAFFWRAADVLKQNHMQIVIEETVFDELTENDKKRFLNEYGRAVARKNISNEKIDFIVVLGGDGTIIWTSHTHQSGIPPIVSFALGSLGFMTPFNPNKIKNVIEKVIKEPERFKCSIRSRIEVLVYRDKGEAPNSAFSARHAHQKQKIIKGRRYVLQNEGAKVLNEVVIDRGPTSTVVDLEIYVSDKLIATVQGDGLIVSTPTGSTAYSVTAGGSLIHPALSALAVTPICCNPLAFRPFVVSDNQVIRVFVPKRARHPAHVAFDGSGRIQLDRGDFIECKFSSNPLLWFCGESDNGDWLNAIEHSFKMSDKRERKSLALTSPGSL